MFSTGVHESKTLGTPDEDEVVKGQEYGSKS